MRLQHLKIHHYRSIRDLALECDRLSTLLGPNNHGKSNILSSLEFALSTSSKPTVHDFFARRNTGDDELWVEMTFCDLTEQEKRTFRRYLLSDENVCIRKTARLITDSVETAYNGWVEQPTNEWLQAENAGNFTNRDAVAATPLKDLVPESGRLSKSDLVEAQAKYIEEHRGELKFERTLESGPLLGQKNVGGGVLPEFFLIPAVRDLTDEIKIKSTTTFGRLMNRAVREMAERDQRFIEAKGQLETVMASLNERGGGEGQSNELAVLEKNIEKELKTWGVRVNIEVTPPEIEKIFELGTDIQLDDGVRTTADRKGHGLQRAMMFALIRSWASALRTEKDAEEATEVRARRQSDSVIFAMEEPELFLHPHAQRRLSASLREIADTPEHQVFICTHSTHFVDLAHYKEIAIVTKQDAAAGSQIRQCQQDLFEGEDVQDRKKRFHMAEWVNPDRGEMFFARRVAFVEGETEKVLIPYLAEKLGIFDPDVSIIDCGSKHNLPLYIAISKAFQIPYIVVHDEDPVPDPVPETWNADKRREKERTFRLNTDIRDSVQETLGKVEMISPDFEGAAGVSRNQGKDKGKALAALEHFEAVPTDQIPARLRSIVTAVYAQVSVPSE